MSEKGLNILGARLTPLFYTTSGDPDIRNLSLEGSDLDKYSLWRG